MRDYRDLVCVCVKTNRYAEPTRKKVQYHRFSGDLWRDIRVARDEFIL